MALASKAAEPSVEALPATNEQMARREQAVEDIGGVLREQIP